MDFVGSHFGTNEPLTSQKVRKKVFNWSEVHLYRCNFLQNPYFNLTAATDLETFIYLETGSHGRKNKVLV